MRDGKKMPAMTQEAKLDRYASALFATFLRSRKPSAERGAWNKVITANKISWKFKPALVEMGVINDDGDWIGADPTVEMAKAVMAKASELQRQYVSGLDQAEQSTMDAPVEAPAEAKPATDLSNLELRIMSVEATLAEVSDMLKVLLSELGCKAA